MSARKVLVVLAALSPFARLEASPQGELTEVFEIGAGPGSRIFGTSLAIDGSTAVVGDPAYDPGGVVPGGVVPGGVVPGGVVNGGGAFVFEPGPGGTWVQVAELITGVTGADDGFGSSVSIRGDTAVVGAPNRRLGGQLYAGAAYVFERDLGGPGAWGLRAALLASNVTDPTYGGGFGTAVSAWGDWIAVGATFPLSSKPGGVYLFERDLGGAGEWGETQKFAAAPGVFGYGRSVALEESTLVVGSTSEQAFVLERSGSAWSETQPLVSSTGGGEEFGKVVSLCGDLIAVGAPDADSNRGAVYVFARGLKGPGLFGERERLPNVKGVSDGFGEALELFGERLVVGAKFGAAGGLPETGTAHYYEHQDDAFVWTAELNPSDPSYQDRFGLEVALGDHVALVGAPNGSGVPKLPYIPALEAMTLDPLTNTLFGASFNSGALARFDPATGAGAYVATLDHFPYGLAFDAGSGTLFGVNISEGLFTIDPTSGAGAIVGDLGGRQLSALAFDQSSGWLYGVDLAAPFELLRIDPNNAAVSVVGATGEQGVGGLAFDSETGGLYSVSSRVGYRLLAAVDPATAVVTHIGAVGALPTSASLFLADRLGAGLLHMGNDADFTLNELRTADGTHTLIGPWGALQPYAGPGSVYVFSLPTAVISYCTSGSSAAGCLAELSASGAASASASSGFTLIASEVEGQKDGLFFFGTSGKQANPWGSGNSFQCVVPPLARVGLLVGSGSSGQCDGAFAQDLNAFWCPTCPKATKNPGAGAAVQAQLWYRDPHNTSNQTTSLSGAVEFSVAP